MALIKIADPSDEPVTLAEARLHLRMDAGNTAEDDLISALIKAAREQAEHTLGRALLAQTWEVVLDEFPGTDDAIELPMPDVLSVVSIKYVDTSQLEQTMDQADYALDSAASPGWVAPAYGGQWPTDVLDSTNVVRVRFTCGYGAYAAQVPESIRRWMLLQVGAMYRAREAFAIGASVAELPGRFVAAMLDPHKVYR